MLYRMLNPDEIPAWRRLQDYCFIIPPGDLTPFMENKFDLSTVRGLFQADGTLVAALTNFSFELHLDGGRIGMGGIAAVASAPEHRRGGNVARLLSECLKESREQGLPLSGLYPFDQTFYRKFGWEVASAYLEHKVGVEAIAQFRSAGGAVTRHHPGEEDWREPSAIYDQYVKSLRGYMVRPGEAFWKAWVSSPWRREAMRWHLAVWCPDPGTDPQGYAYYRFETEEGKQVLRVKELIALTSAAREGLFGFLAQHDSAVARITLHTPREFPLWYYFANTSKVETRLVSGAMLRIVDLKRAFEQRPWPSALSGALVIGMTDQMAPWNAGSWRVSFEAGTATVERVSGEQEDLSGAVQTWSQIYSGLVTPQQAVEAGRLQSASPRALDLLQTACAGPSFFYYEFY